MLQTIVFIEMILFFGAILAFSWWQMRLMRREINDEKGSALASPPRPAAVEKTNEPDPA